MSLIETLLRRAELAEAEGDADTATALRDAAARMAQGESRLEEQQPGRMGLGSSQERYARTPGKPQPAKPDPLTRNHTKGGRRRGEP